MMANRIREACTDTETGGLLGGKAILNGTLYHGDCIKIMNSLEAESVKVIVTSPPYNMRKGYDNHEDAMEHEDYVQWQRDCLTAMMRVLRPDGAIFYNHMWRVQGGLLQDRYDIVNGFPVRQIIIWQRKGGRNFNEGYFLPTYEVVYLICKPDFKLASKANAIGDVWKIPQKQKNEHPAPFPVEFARRCIESVDTGVVLDPFIGSGTTAIAAEITGRPWIGIDNSEKYCEMTQKRLTELEQREGVHHVVYWPFLPWLFPSAKPSVV